LTYFGFVFSHVRDEPRNVQRFPRLAVADGPNGGVQSGGAQPASPAPDVLPSVTVIARKTKEVLLNVPASVTVINAEDLGEAPMDPQIAITQKAPNVVWNASGASQGFYTIGGISSLGTPANKFVQKTLTNFCRRAAATRDWTIKYYTRHYSTNVVYKNVMCSVL
jgi:hypothetical protein